MQSKPSIGFEPEWPAPPFVRALMTTRKGGVSNAPWNELNLGLLSGDKVSDVHHNRALVEQALGVPAVYMRQVHGTQGVAVTPSTPSNTEADVAWTTQAGVAFAIMAADCLPILVCHPTVKWVAGAHAGWRGLAGQEGHGVVETLAHSAKAHGVSPQDCVVWLGPCIGPTAFEVGEDVFAAFGSLLEKSDNPTNLFFQTSPNKYMANLAGLARERLKAAGFRSVHGNDSSLPWCTYRQETLYHSHRRDAVAKGGSGRMAAYIWITT
jgi:YfiH family protein